LYFYTNREENESMKKLIIANWKMNPSSVSAAVRLAAKTEKGALKSGNDIVVAPPFPFLLSVKKVLKKAKLGAQDDFWENQGAYTGEISPAMLKSSGVKYVIVGHSERRRLGETDDAINKKIKASLKAGLKPILCVGESLEVRKKGLTAAKNFVKSQLKKDLKGLPRPGGIIVAYEPIWAIGTGKSDKPQDTVEMAIFIKGIAGSKAKILYGGSVTSKNAKNFLQYKEIDGALVGGASLKAGEFNKIINSANK